MKKTIYFKSQEEMLDYYGGEVSNIPSNTLAIVADENDFVLFSTSNNQSMNGSMEDQGGYIDNISGYAYVTTNGDHNVASYEMVNVNVPNVIPSGYVYVNGTYNISENGTFDISSYENAYVSVQTGGVDYQWIDPASYTMVIGEKYAFNGELGTNPQAQITSQFIEMYPALTPYLNWYVYSISGENNSSNWSKTAIIETPGDLPGHGVIAKGTWTEPVTGNPMFIVDELYAAKYAGGNGTLNITSNGTQQVVRYQSVSVNVPSAGSSVEYYTGEIYNDGSEDIYSLTPATLPYTNVCAHNIDPNDDINIVRGTDRLWFTADGGTTYYCVGGALYANEDEKSGDMPQSASGILMKLDAYPNNAESVRLFNNSQYTLSNITTTISAIPNNANIYNVAVSFSYS